MKDFFTNVDPINKIIEGLYLGNYIAATDLKILRKYKITHILRLTKEDVGEMYQDEFTYKLIELRDIPEQNISYYFEEAHRFIDQALRGSFNTSTENRVLVHCHAGVSRSSTIVISYLMKKYINFSLKEALRHVKSKRPIIHPNSGFMKQLEAYEKDLKNKLWMSESFYSFTTKVSSTDSHHEQIHTHRPLMKSLFASTPTLNHLKTSLRYELPVHSSTPDYTPFINQEKQKLYSTLNYQKMLSTPICASEKSWNSSRNVLKTNGIDVLHGNTVRALDLSKIRIHPNVYAKQNLRKSTFARYGVSNRIASQYEKLRRICYRF